MGKWEQFESDEIRKSFPMDYRFRRTLISFRGMVLAERIRVVQYPPQMTSMLITDMVLDKRELEPHIIYSRFIGSSDERIANYLFKGNLSFYKSAHRILSKLFSKQVRIFDIKNSKYIEYPFVRELFKDIKREDTLKKLGL